MGGLLSKYFLNKMLYSLINRHSNSMKVVLTLIRFGHQRAFIMIGNIKLAFF